MEEFIRLAGPNQAVEVLGIRLVGVNVENGTKLLVSVLFIVLVLLLHRLLRRAIRQVPKSARWERIRFWARQALGLGTVLVLLFGLASIWFDDPRRLATALGLVTAGLAFALQRVVTAIAGYFVILRGKTFNVGDRIVMGGVRGDVIALRITQTTIMEMGQPPTIQENADPAMWVRSRQYTGRIVTVSNARIFDEPVYNYTRDFPYLWEEIAVPVTYAADRERAESIMLKTAKRHTLNVSELSAEALQEMRRRYFMKTAEIAPRVYLRLTDNWVEMTVRFIVEERGIREVKDAMSRELLREMEAAGIAVASQTIDVVGVPRLEIGGERQGHARKA